MPGTALETAEIIKESSSFSAFCTEHDSYHLPTSRSNLCCGITGLATPVYCPPKSQIKLSQLCMQVDCTSSKKTCDEYGVTGVPNLKVFMKGVHVAEFYRPKTKGWFLATQQSAQEGWAATRLHVASISWADVWAKIGQTYFQLHGCSFPGLLSADDIWWFQSVCMLPYMGLWICLHFWPSFQSFDPCERGVFFLVLYVITWGKFSLYLRKLGKHLIDAWKLRVWVVVVVVF